MKKISLYVLILITVVQCRKESEDCHFFITVKNNSDKEIIFLSSADISYLNNEICNINGSNIKKIQSGKNIKYQPYHFSECIENVVKVNDNNLLSYLHIIDAHNYSISNFPCEEFEERNTILRTYILTLEDLERLNYTINYPEDVSIGLE